MKEEPKYINHCPFCGKRSPELKWLRNTVKDKWYAVTNYNCKCGKKFDLVFERDCLLIQQYN